MPIEILLENFIEILADSAVEYKKNPTEDTKQALIESAQAVWTTYSAMDMFNECGLICKLED